MTYKKMIDFGNNGNIYEPDHKGNELKRGDFSEEIGVLPLKNTVLMPGMVAPITVSREVSLQLIRKMLSNKDKYLAVVAQKNPEIENPNFEDLNSVGVLAEMVRHVRMPDGSLTILLMGKKVIKIESFVTKEPFFIGKFEFCELVHPKTEVEQALLLALKTEAETVANLLPNLPSEASLTLQNIDNLETVCHFVSSHLNIKTDAKQEIIEISNLEDLSKKVLEYLIQERKILEITDDIQSRVRLDMDRQQKDFILRQQAKAIQDELGEGEDSEIQYFIEKGDRKNWSSKVQFAFDKEIRKLERLNQSSPEYSVVANYIEWMLDLPWNTVTKDRLDLDEAEKILNEEHFGLEKIKQRILEYLAVIKLRKDLKSPILCFVGPPGVGKTSLARSIANAMKRKYVRMSLGGVRDEAEIRGHRRTYIGAMPGRIIQNLKKAKSNNPVFVLDEVDKIGHDWKGDPASALLEVLDPEQNVAFNDHFLELDYNLSKVMFIATANSLETLHPALLDRMEIIELSGYSLQEKSKIAFLHLIPKQIAEHGLSEKEIDISECAIQTLIENYTRESGVRQLSQKIGSLCRVMAKEVVQNKTNSFVIDSKAVKEMLGAPKFESESNLIHEVPGIATGLAWTSVGGEVLTIETAMYKGNGRLNLTGQLGAVMKESAMLSYTYLKAKMDELQIPAESFTQWDVHIHIPAGAVPKDGPSAGITLATALTSAFTKRKVKGNFAMTGEMTLRGKILPVGGIKEKVLAAQRIGITDIILCKANESDVNEISPYLLENLTFHYVEKFDEVLALCLEEQIDTTQGKSIGFRKI